MGSNVLVVIILKCTNVRSYFVSFPFSITSGCFLVLDARHTFLLCHAPWKGMQKEDREESVAEDMFLWQKKVQRRQAQCFDFEM